MGKAVYLVLDMINDLVDAAGPGRDGPFVQQVVERDVIGKTSQALQKARAARVQIGYVRVGFSADYREIPASSPIFSRIPAAGIFKLGTRGTEVHPCSHRIPRISTSSSIGSARFTRQASSCYSAVMASPGSIAPVFPPMRLSRQPYATDMTVILR